LRHPRRIGFQNEISSRGFPTASEAGTTYHFDSCRRVDSFMVKQRRIAILPCSGSFSHWTRNPPFRKFQLKTSS